MLGVRDRGRGVHSQAVYLNSLCIREAEAELRRAVEALSAKAGEAAAGEDYVPRLPDVHDLIRRSRAHG